MKTYVKELISNASELDHAERVAVKTALGLVDEFQKVCDLIESLQDDNPHCPHCSATRIHRHGTSAGLQRYKCTNCGKTFNALTKTPLARMRKKELWLAYMGCMLNSNVLDSIHHQLSINIKTAFLWRHHFTAWLGSDVPRTLDGIIEADETYFRKSRKGDKHLNRKPHKHGGDGLGSGISKDLVCVLAACDRSGHDLEFITGVGAVKGVWLDVNFAGRVESDAVLVTDGLRSYRHFIKYKHITHVIVNRKKHKSGSFHIQHVNAYHMRMKRQINHHFRGVATKYLNHYLWWLHELRNKHITNSESLFLASIAKSHT